MPGFRLTYCAPRVVTVHHRPALLNQRGHVSACPGRPSQAQSPARPGSPHRRYRSTRCMGTVRQHRSVCSARALHTPALATPTDAGPPATGPRVCWPSGHDADTLRATAAPPGTDFVRRSACSKAGSHDQRFACVDQSAGALSPKASPRFASC